MEPTPPSPAASVIHHPVCKAAESLLVYLSAAATDE
jgi:hypothetical protein